jgi:hypothetical protein
VERWTRGWSTVARQERSLALVDGRGEETPSLLYICTPVGAAWRPDADPGSCTIVIYA